MDKILIIDDEIFAVEEIAESMELEGFSISTASSGDEAIEFISIDKEINVIITDINMPGKSGIELIEAIKRRFSDREFEYIIMTGNNDISNAIESIHLGVRDFILKPLDVEVLIEVVNRALELIHLRKVKLLYEEAMKADNYQKNIKIRRMNHELESAYQTALNILGIASDYKDNETGEHIKRIGIYAEFLAKKMGWKEKRAKMIGLAAPLHDVGKIGIPDAILLKKGKLTDEEFEVMKSHPLIGKNILKGSKNKIMAMASEIAYNHHERWNGSGYPKGIAGKEIPESARIVTLVDIYDALRSERPYKPALSHEKAMEIITCGDGRAEPDFFDPVILKVFIEYQKEIEAIYEGNIFKAN